MQTEKQMMSIENYERIEFVSEGAVLRGRLYRPTGVADDLTNDVRS